ncbi:MAG: DegT/DnrJ/EryC1/StrS family aminotransferase [Polyangiaceae bacterium]
MIAHSKPTLDSADAAAVSAVVASGQLACGPRTAEFEDNVAAYIGATAGVAFSSGSAALHASLVALRIGPGDEVLLPSYVCTAPYTAIQLAGATPVLVDIDGRTFNIDVEDARSKVSPRTRAVIAPHMFGLPADVEGLTSIGRRVAIIEDCAMSLGTRIGDQRAGSRGVCAVFSFYATKMISTGEGGMVLSSDATLLDALRDLRAYDGREAYAMRPNYKMTDMQGALGTTQLHKLPSFIERRREIARTYDAALRALGHEPPLAPLGVDQVYYRYVVRVPSADDFIAAMHVHGVDCRKPVYKPIHRYLGSDACPVADDVWRTAVSIPIYPSLSNAEMAHVVRSMTDVVRALKSGAQF